MIEILIGLIIGLFAVVIIEYLVFRSRCVELQKEIRRLKTQLTLKAVLTPIVIDLINNVLKPLFKPVERVSKENSKDGVKSKRKNNVHKRP
ncbi:hypothetical protein ES702_07155 [subsurface metagenome]